MSFNPFFLDRQFSDTGIPLAGGLLYTYAAGVGNTAQLAVYQDSAGAIPFSFPVVLNAGGIPTGNSGNPVPIIWLQGGKAYKFILTDDSNNVIWEEDGYAQQATLDTVLSLTAVALRGLAGTSNGQAVYVEGTTALGDGGEGWWYWNSTSGATDDLGTVIAVSGVGTGRWLRFVEKYINVRWFAAKGDSATDDTGAFTAAVNTAANYPRGAQTLPLPLYAPPGAYKLSSNPSINFVPIYLATQAILVPEFELHLCPVINDMSQHFDVSGTGTIVFENANVYHGLYNNGAPVVAYPEWFGALGDNTTNDVGAINRAMFALSVTHGTVKLSHKYGISSPITLVAGVSLVGDSSLPVITQLAAGFVCITGDNVTGCALRDFTVVEAIGSTDDSMDLASPNGVEISRVTLPNLLSITNGDSITIRDCTLAATTLTTVNRTHLRGCHLTGTLSLSTTLLTEVCNNILSAVTLIGAPDEVIISGNDISGALTIPSGAINITVSGNHLASVSDSVASHLTSAVSIVANTPTNFNDDYQITVSGRMTNSGAGNGSTVITYNTGIAAGFTYANTMVISAYMSTSTSDALHVNVPWIFNAGKVQLVGSSSVGTVAFVTSDIDITNFYYAVTFGRKLT